MAKPLPRSLNLLQPSEKPTSTWDRIYVWVFTVGRYLIIVVELIVLVAFVARFALDRRNNDLTDEITVKMEMLDAQKETEQELRRVQSTLDNLSRMLDEQEKLSPQLETVLKEIPSSLTIETFALSQRAINLSGIAPTYEDLKEFEETLRKNEDYENVNLTLTKGGNETADVNFEISVYFPEDAA